MSSAAVSGQSSVTWQGPPLTGTPNTFPDSNTPITLTGQMDSTTGAISGASLSLPPLPQPEQQGENTTFTFSEVSPGTATGTYNSTTGAVTLNDSLKLTFTGTGLAAITCVSQPITVALSGTYDSTTQDVTLATTSSFTIPQFSATSGENCGAASPHLNASPGGVAGSVGNAMTLALHGDFSPLLPTTTGLTTSVPSPQLAGTSVTLNATVTDPSAAGTPTGTVNFEDNGSSIGTGTLSPSGTTGTATASLTTTTLPQTANQQLTTVYLGDTSYAGSTSAAVPYTIQAKPTISSTFPSQFTTGTTSFPTPTPFTLTITNPAGGATYSNLFLYLGIGSPSGKLPAANIQLAYQDQAGNWCPLTLATTNKPPTGSPLPTSAPGAFFSGLGTAPCGFASSFSLDPGSSLTLSMEAAFESAPSKGVAFGSISLASALETGTCASSTSCTAVAPLSGKVAVTSQAASDLLPQAGPGTQTATITDESWPTSVAAADGNFRSGYLMQLIAKVSYAAFTGAPTGTVQFLVDGNLAATVTIPAYAAGNLGGAPLVTAGFYNPGPLAPGTHTLTINYSGDQNFAPNSLTDSFTVIGGLPPGTPFACAVTTFTGGAATNFNAYVTASGAGVPTAAFSGTSVTVNNASVTLDIDAASEAGNAGDFNPQSGQAMTFSPGGSSVDPGQTTFALSTSGTDIVGTWSGISTTMTVTGSPGSTVPIGVSSISFAGTAGITVDCTPVSGPAAIGSVGIIGTTLSASPSGSAPAGSPVTLTATVAPLPPGANGATGDAVAPGQVDFYDGSTYLGTANVDPTAGTASFTTNTLSVGDHQLTADWSGYSGVPPSTSNTVDYAVGTSTTTTVASSANPANAATPVTFTATVSPPQGSTTQPTGDVNFTVDGNAPAACQNAALSTDSPPTATCTLTLKAGTTHQVVATYSGDPTYLGSVSGPLTQTMSPPTSSTLAPGATLTKNQSLIAATYRLTMQGDGNLVEYQGSKALWNTGTEGHPGAGLVMQKDGNLVIYSKGKAIWASKTSGHEGSSLVLQGSDGNVVIYTPAHKAIWATGA